MSVEVSFDAASHTYRVDGVVRPSVTTILSTIERGFEFVNPDILEAARSLGNHVHLATHLFDRDELDEEALDPNLKPYLDQWKRFLVETGFKVTHTEEIVYNRSIDYCGRLDKRGIWRGTTWVLDLKSGAVPKTCAIQTSAYQQAASERPRKRAALQLTPTSYRLIPYSDPADFSLFISARNIYRYQNGH